MTALEPMLLLDKQQVLQKVDRMAIEVYERNYNLGTVILLGIWQEGLALATLLKASIEALTPLTVVLGTVKVDKHLPTLAAAEIGLDQIPYGATVILVDDVIDSGKTLMHAMVPLLQLPLHSLQTAVLVDRGHAVFPVATNYVGYSLSNTTSDRISVVLSQEDQFGVYLIPGATA